MDAELAAKRAAGYNPELEKEAQQWIEAVTGESFPGSFHEALKDGVLLCKYVLSCSLRHRLGEFAQFCVDFRSAIVATDSDSRVSCCLQVAQQNLSWCHQEDRHCQGSFRANGMLRHFCTDLAHHGLSFLTPYINSVFSHGSLLLYYRKTLAISCL